MFKPGNEKYKNLSLLFNCLNWILFTSLLFLHTFAIELRMYRISGSYPVIRPIFHYPVSGYPVCYSIIRYPAGYHTGIWPDTG